MGSGCCASSFLQRAEFDKMASKLKGFGLAKSELLKGKKAAMHEMAFPAVGCLLD